MKKIMIALLAIAVLFGFAACDNSGSGAAGTLAMSIYSDDCPVVVEGEKVTLADWTLKGVDMNGNPVSIDAADVSIDAADDDGSVVMLTDSTDKAKVETVSVKTSWGGSGTLNVKVLPVTAITVDASKAVDTEYYAVISTDPKADDYKKINSEGVVVTATYIDEDGAEQKKVVDNSLVKFELNTATDWNSANNDAEVKVSYADKSNATTFKVDIVENKVVSLDVEVAAGYELIADGTATLDTSKFKVYGTYQNKQRAEVTVKYSSETTYNDDVTKKTYGEASAIKYEAGTEAGTKTIYVKYDGNVAENGSRYANGNISVVADSLKGLRVTVTALTLATDYDYSGDKAYPDQIKVEALYKGATKAITLEAKTGYTLSPLTAREGLEAKDTVTFTVTPVGTNVSSLAPVTFDAVVGTALSGTFGLPADAPQEDLEG